MAARIEFVVYVIGVALFGLFYESLKAAVGVGLWFFICAIAYLCCLRAIGYAARRYMELRRHQ